MTRERPHAQPGSPNGATYTVSVAANLAGMHAQTLRQYDRLGLVTPGRTKGGGRRYGPADLERLRHIQELTQTEGINLAGVQRVLDLEDKLQELQKQLEELASELRVRRKSRSGVFTADSEGKVQFQERKLPVPPGLSVSPQEVNRTNTVQLARPSGRALARPGLTGWQLLAALRLRQLLRTS